MNVDDVEDLGYIVAKRLLNQGSEHFGPASDDDTGIFVDLVAIELNRPELLADHLVYPPFLLVELELWHNWK